MSSILEALKKLEEEKATRRGAGGNIAGKVTAANRRSRQRPAWHLPAGIAAAVVAAVLVTYAAMGGFSPRPEVTSAGKGPAPASVTATVPSPPADPRDGMKSEPMTRLPVPEPEPVRGAVPRTSPAPRPVAERLLDVGLGERAEFAIHQVRTLERLARIAILGILPRNLLTDIVLDLFL